MTMYTGTAVSRVRAKMALPAIGKSWWSVVVGGGVPDGNIAGSGVGVCVGLVLVPERKKNGGEEWATEQLGGNFSWCFSLSRACIYICISISISIYIYIYIYIYMYICIKTVVDTTSMYSK